MAVMVRNGGKPGWGRRPWVLVAGQAALAGSALVLIAVWHTKDLGTAANLAQLLSAALAIPTLSAGLFTWWRRSGTPSVADREMLASATDALARLVGRQWDNEAQALSLDDPDPIPETIHAAPTPVPVPISPSLPFGRDAASALRRRPTSRIDERSKPSSSASSSARRTSSGTSPTTA